MENRQLRILRFWKENPENIFEATKIIDTDKNRKERAVRIVVSKIVEATRNKGSQRAGRV